MRTRFKKWIFTSNPLYVTIISIVTSVLVYIAVAAAVGLEDFYSGLIISIVVPTVVAYPIAHFMRSNLLRIEEQNRMLAELDTENKKLFSVLSHDLRSPIASLKSVLDLMLEDELDKETSREMLELVSEKTNNMLVFLNEILHWTKDQIEQKKLHPVVFDTSAVLRQVIDLYGDILSEKEISLIYDAPSVNVYADKDSYAFIVRNLVQNALKFTNKGGKIEVSTKASEGMVRTTIKDTGVGIAAEDLEKIRNQKLWFTTEGVTGEKGTGFGLNTCFNFARENQGDLEIESEPGKGTNITLSLPESP
ncbi:MAG: HAMP domain-containing histidine kinase [Phaeodactylibacter sp.]|nr:HAMP domain-containing histidine kinase [Phaeodactylibacter sp.]